jgi:hypothetical protein
VKQQQFEITGFSELVKKANQGGEVQQPTIVDHFDRQFTVATPEHTLDGKQHVVDVKSKEDRILENFTAAITDESELEAVRQAVREFREELLRKRKQKKN